MNDLLGSAIEDLSLKVQILFSMLKMVFGNDKTSKFFHYKLHLNIEAIYLKLFG